MAESPAFNQPCACGSGDPYKKCCGRAEYVERAQRRNRRVGLVLLVAGGVGAFIYFNREQAGGAFIDRSKPVRVWNEEHQHFHDVTIGKEKDELVPQPAGEVPEGKVWSPEHGHWHDATPLDQSLPTEHHDDHAGHNH